MGLVLDMDSYPSVHMARIEGRLHLCSRSLVFEPNESSRGIVRFPFKRMKDSPREYPSDTGFEAMCVEFSCKRHAVMKANNVVGPFESVPLPVRCRFTFLHSSPTSFVELCQNIFQLSINGKSGPSHATPELDGLTKPMLDRPFRSDHLVDVREQPLASNLRCALLSPLQSKPGVLVLTAERLYFQPASGVLTATDTRALNWMQRDVVATARRYKGLRDSALEIYWKDESSTLLAFERRHDREQVMRFLPSNVPCFTDRDCVVQVAQEWQKGAISNYDYLLALNSAAGRSFHDLSRYPVFPWVIADYESTKLDLTKQETFRDLTKPVGALNQERLEYFQKRLEGMQDMDESFLYGTHYSVPGYVLYYLVRSMPEHMLCLQNGRFDSPDRMFHSIKHCFGCVLSNHADLKELIPEFYNADNDFDFLINARGLQLGATQGGDRVDDVKLPPWARSARDFIKKNRKALESEICTRMLPRWIDLIFGCKSRGDAAMEANNMFHHISYLGPTDLAGMQTEEERFQAELQATEFGIVPDMLFRGPHPLRQDAVNDDFISPDIGRASSKDDAAAGREAWELLDRPSNSSSQAEFRPSVRVPSYDNPVEESEKEFATGAAALDSHASKRPHLSESRNERWQDGPQHLSNAPSSDSRESTGRNLPLRGAGDLSHRQSGDSGAFSSADSKGSLPQSPSDTSLKVRQFPDSPSSGEWDMQIIERKRIHGDAVSGCVLLLQEGDGKKPMLATTSLDGGLLIHSLSLALAKEEEDDTRRGFSSTLNRLSLISRGQGQATPATRESKLTEFRSHSSRDPLASLALANDGVGGNVAFAGGHDDVVLAYGVNSACAVASVYSHRDAVTGLDLIPRTPFDKDNALWLENSTHIMASGSWDATVKVWSVTVAAGETVSINREPLAELFDADSSIVCISTKTIPGGGIVIAAGCTDGSFVVWNVHTDGVQVVIHSEPARRGSGPCSVVKWISEGGRLHLFAGFATGKVASYALAEGALDRESAVSVGVAVLSLVYSEGILLVGCSDGGLRLIPVRDGGHFDSKPTLWNAVNNKSSPGISTISIAYEMIQNRCICCTGGEDGSVALFELKRAIRPTSI
jgi:factor associated with neutral sphingomyelinase activation